MFPNLSASFLIKMLSPEIATSVEHTCYFFIITNYDVH
jgi:hypothetical protein